MNFLARFLVICSLSLVFTAQTQARGSSPYEETYNVGLIAGNLDGGTEYGEVQASGFVLSARNQKAVLEYVNMSSSKGTVLSTGDAWEANISGIYLSLLGQGQPYMKFKVGSIKQEMVITSGSVTATTNSVTSYGLGMGYQLGSRVKIEFDVSSLDNDMTLFAITVLF